jgi:hypothetical protein
LVNKVNVIVSEYILLASSRLQFFSRITGHSSADLKN